MLTVEGIRALAACGVKMVSVVTDDADALFDALVHDSDDVWAPCRWQSVQWGAGETRDLPPAMYRRRQGALIVAGVSVHIMSKAQSYDPLEKSVEARAA